MNGNVIDKHFGANFGLQGVTLSALASVRVRNSHGVITWRSQVRILPLCRMWSARCRNVLQGFRAKPSTGRR